MNYNKKYLYLRVVKAKQFLDKKYAEDMDLNNVIAVANISKYHFIRLFKKMYGVTPHQYLIQIRIKKAKQQLKKTKDTVSMICHRVGFSSVNSFSNLFKKVTFYTPLQYRKAYLKAQSEQEISPLSQIPGCYTLAYKLLE